MATLLKRPLAELDVLDIWDYIADDSPDRADNFLNRIESKLMTLAQNSGLSRKGQSCCQIYGVFLLVIMLYFISRLREVLM